MEKDHNNKGLNQDRSASAAPWPSLTIDYDLYQKHLDASDMNDAQKREFLDALWAIIVSFVDMGFGVHPLQQAQQQVSEINGSEDDNKDCEQLDIPAEFLPADLGDMVELPDQSHSIRTSDKQSGQMLKPLWERSQK